MKNLTASQQQAVDAIKTHEHRDADGWVWEWLHRFKRVSAAAAAKRGALEVQEREHGLYYRPQDTKEAK